MRESIPDIFDLPKDVVLDLPRITVVGDRQVLVENHRGIASYRPDLLSIGYSSGRVSIRGCRLSIASISKDEVLIEGRVTTIRIDPDEVGQG